MAARWECDCDHLSWALGATETEGDEYDLRKFNPSSYGFPPDAVPGDVLHSDPDCCPIVHVKSPAHCNLMCVALYADGACSGNGTPQARSSVGVYGTPGAWYNKGYLLPPPIPQTNQSAEIYSAIAALDVAQAILRDRWDGKYPLSFGKHEYTIVILVMDSMYVVQAMTQWIRKWRANGFRSARGERVANMEALQTLDNEIRRLFEDHLIIVRFWHVPRMYNAGADKIATEALRGNEIGYDLDSDLESLTKRFALEW